MKPIRKTVSTILELHVQNWDDVFVAADQQGKLTGSRTNKILRALCEAVEELQNAK